MNHNAKDIEIAVLHQISRTVLHERNVSTLFRNVLHALHEKIGFERGTFTLLRDDVLFIEASHGLTEAEIRRGKYHLGEGITGRVAQIAEPILIPDISEDPNFLNRTKTRDQLRGVAFLCVPILHRENVIGTLSMDREVKPGTDLQRDMRLLETVANIMADAVQGCIQQHEEREKLLAENQRLREELDNRGVPSGMVGNCSLIRAVFAQIAQVSATDAPVLIRGNPGTGKELVAREIHLKSTRRDAPLLPISCASMPDAFLEQELFGSFSNAIPGERIRRPGKLEDAHGGTVYLDEVADLSMPLQMKLLHFLQGRPLHANDAEPSSASPDVRIVAGTSRDLERLIHERKFSEALYYRLHVFPIYLPDLRNRRSDIILLAESFLEHFSVQYSKEIRRISTPAINMLMSYHWPGNVRELENCMERAVLAAQNDVIAGYDLPPSLQSGESAPALREESIDKADFATLVESFERELIVGALKSTRGNVSAAARALNLTNRILHYKIAKLQITPEWYRIDP